MPNGVQAFVIEVAEPRASDPAPALVASRAVEVPKPAVVVEPIAETAKIAPVVPTLPAEKLEIDPMPMPLPAPDVVQAPAPVAAPKAIEEAKPAPTVVAAEMPPAPAVDEAKPAMIEVVDLEALRPEAPKPADPAAGFQVAMQGVMASFTADIAPAPAAEPTPLIAEVQVSDDDDTLDIDPALASVPGYESEKAATMEPSNATEPGEGLCGAENPVVEQARSNRLSQAVRLTNQAVNAWASLLKVEGAGTSLRR